jgi:glycosyltransferase involved in cell wall biosynthesis
MNNPFLSIIIPAYNEETNIRIGALDKVVRYLEKQTYTWEVIIVDDGSSDCTAGLVQEAVGKNRGFKILMNSHQGKAASIVTGIKKSHGSIILFCDLDQATPLHEIEKMLPWFEKGYDIVIGSRKTKREGAPLFRMLMARGFTILRTLILGMKGISDTQCGFKSFRRNAALYICQTLSLYGKQQAAVGAKVTAGFDIEVLFLANTLGFSIKEVPVEWHYIETRRVNPIQDSWQGFTDIVNIRFNAWKGVYTTKRTS